MVSKFKKKDIVYFTNKNNASCLEYPLKGSLWQCLGVVISDDKGVITVLWENGTEHSYYEDSLGHKNITSMFFRYIYDIIKEDLKNIKFGISNYMLYRRFKIDDKVCLKHSTELLSTCDIGIVDRKCYPNMVIYWVVNGVDYTYQSAESIKHYTGLDPNKSFELYKRNNYET